MTRDVTRQKNPPPWYVLAAVASAGVVVGVLAYRTQIDNLGPLTTPTRAAMGVAAGWAFLVAGLVALTRRPGNRIGLLMTLVCFALLARQLRYSHDPLAFTAFTAIGELAYALFAHTALAYPSGRVIDRLERAYLGVTYAIALVFPAGVLLFYDGSERLRYFDPVPRESLLLVSGRPGIVNAIEIVYAGVGYGVLATVLVVLLARRLVLATPRARRTLAPLALAGAVAATRAVVDSVITFAPKPPAVVYWNLHWWQMAGLIALPAAYLWGMLRSRLSYATVGQLVVELDGTPPREIRTALARALRDPSVEVFFWLPERQAYVDVDGRPVALPEETSNRAVTRLDGDQGEPLAVLVHDPALRDEPELIDIASAAARLALENARLHAEVQAQLAQVKESRARIANAADDERRRIERDLHDGAQQLLVARAIELKRALRNRGGTLDPELERLLVETADDLQGAARGIRDLAAGIHPGVLTQGGLPVALEALAARVPFPVTVDADFGRLAPEVEGTAYFVVSEALTNTAKHAHATRASVSARVEDGRLVVEVVDDGVGGAAVNGGSGLRGLADRVEAHGGRLSIVSPAGDGTRLVGEIPCAS